MNATSNHWWTVKVKICRCSGVHGYTCPRLLVDMVSQPLLITLSREPPTTGPYVATVENLTCLPLGVVCRSHPSASCLLDLVHIGRQSQCLSNRRNEDNLLLVNDLFVECPPNRIPPTSCNRSSVSSSSHILTAFVGKQRLLMTR